MASLTSLAGLLPLVLFPAPAPSCDHGCGGHRAGGLALSTALTLVVVPALFTLVWRVRLDPLSRAETGESGRLGYERPCDASWRPLAACTTAPSSGRWRRCHREWQVEATELRESPTTSTSTPMRSWRADGRWITSRCWPRMGSTPTSTLSRWPRNPTGAMYRTRWALAPCSTRRCRAPLAGTRLVAV